LDTYNTNQAGKDRL